MKNSVNVSGQRRCSRRTLSQPKENRARDLVPGSAAQSVTRNPREPATRQHHRSIRDDKSSALMERGINKRTVKQGAI